MAALTVVNPIVGAAVLAYEHKDKIESTLGKAADTVKKEAVVVEKKQFRLLKQLKQMLQKLVAQLLVEYKICICTEW